MYWLVPSVDPQICRHMLQKGINPGNGSLPNGTKALPGELITTKVSWHSPDGNFQEIFTISGISI